MSKIPPPPPPIKPAGPAGVTWEPFALPGIDVRLYRAAGPKRPGVPEIDPGYQFREELVREAAWAVWPHDNGHPSAALLVGPKGCGKTSLITQLAAHCNVPVRRVNLNVGTTTRNLFGRVAAEKGATYFVPGVVTLAMEEGSWLLLDEISGATPPVALSLFPVLEPDGAVWLEESQPPRYATRHKDFRIFATDNTIGAEQEDSRFSYSGTNPDMNEALLDRFGSTLQVGYLEPRMEHMVIKALVPKIDDWNLAVLIRTAKAVRESGHGVAFSTRMVIDWARRIAAGHQDQHGGTTEFTSDDILAAADAAFLRKVRSRVERDAIAEVARRLLANVKGD